MTKDIFGNPTVGGFGNSCTKEVFEATANTAASICNSGTTLYSICFGAANEEVKNPNTGAYISLFEYLNTYIALNKTYSANDFSGLKDAFDAISSSITSGLSSGTVHDSLPDGVTCISGDFEGNRNLTGATGEPGEGGVTTYTYTKTYTVKIDPTAVDAEQYDGYYPLNGPTTLTVKGSNDEDVTIDFPIPAGKVTMPSHTVTWKSQDGITTLETDNNVEYNTQPSFDQADPTKADDAQYTYTFVGWATEANKETGTLEADLPPVTDDVTYYAAFSKTARTYTVTWMPQDGQDTAYETDTGVAYNARPSYDGTEPTKAADAEHTYTFVGWATTPNQTSGSAVDALPKVTEDVTYYAAFSATKQTYTIRFETESGRTLTGKTEAFS